MNIAALGTVPDNGVFTLEDPTILQIGNKVTVLFCVLLFSPGNGCKDGRYHGEPFFFRDFSKSRVHFHVLVLFSGSSTFQVFHGAAYDTGRKGCLDINFTTFQQFEQALGMGSFLFCGALKDGSNLDISFFLCSLGGKGLAIAGLGFAGKGGHDIGFGP
jgi:hypothetical protein